MLVSTRVVIFGLLLSLGAGVLYWSASRPLYFCEAAQTPAAYGDEWFYRLHRGPDGWLLRDDDLATTFSLDKRTLAYLTRLNGLLEQQNVTLILAAQPPRGVALSDRSLPDYDPGAAVARYEATRATLEQAGLHVTDLAAVVDESPNYFFRRDHHWTPEGAQGSAEAVAETLRATAAYRTLTPGSFRTEAVREEEQVGSFGEAIGRICGRNPPAEPLTRYRTTSGEAAGSLFGDAPAPPIALAGTSNSAREDLNFAGFLEQATGLGVLNASAIGGGPQAALESYLRSETFHKAKPAFIVWEFATLFDVPDDPVFYRQLIPSVRGACSVGVATVTEALTGPETVLFSDAPEGSAFLYLEFSDLSQKAFALTLSYRGGRSETVQLRRSGRETNEGRFFLELSGEAERITLTLPDEASGTVQARLCP